MIPIQNLQIHGDRKYTSSYLGLGHRRGWQGRGVMANEYKVSFRGDENILGEFTK